MSEDALSYIPSSVVPRGSESASRLSPLGSLDSQHQSPYPMHSATGKPEGSDVPFQSAPGGDAYAPGKKQGASDAEGASQMDPHLPGGRRTEGTPSGYPHVRQEQPPYRLDLLQTDPNLESGAPLQSDSAEQGTQSAFSSNHRPCDACLPLFVQLDRRARG